MSNILHFIKNWTLPVSMGIGAVAYLVFYYVPALEGASQWFAPFFNSILPLFMFLILYVTFCKVDFKKLAPVKWHFWTTACQLLFVMSIPFFRGVVNRFDCLWHSFRIVF